MKGTKQTQLHKILTPCAVGLGIHLAIMCLGALAIAVCIHNEYLNIYSSIPSTLILRFISAFFACLVICKGRGEVSAAKCGILLAGILILDLCVGGAFFQIDPSSLGWGIMAVIGGIITAVVVCRTTKSHGIRRKRGRVAR